MHGAGFEALEAEMPAGPTALLTLPYFEPTGAPHFVADAAGAVLGLRSTTTRGELYKSLLESVAFYSVGSLRRLAGLGFVLREVVATGGGARSDRWLQIHADVWGVPVSRLDRVDAGVAGAAMLAGLGTGVYRTPAEARGLFVRHERAFEPDAGRHAAYAALCERYERVFPATREVLRELRGGG